MSNSQDEGPSTELPEAFNTEKTEEGQPLGGVVYGDTEKDSPPGIVDEGSQESFPASDAPTTMPPTTVSSSPGTNPEATENAAT